MHAKHQEFIDAIHGKKKLRIVFFSEEDGRNLERICAPMDYAAGTVIRDGIPRYWVWDYDSDKKVHTLPLRSERIVSITTMEQSFDPSEFITWKTNWTVARDWGHFS